MHFAIRPLAGAALVFALAACSASPIVEDPTMNPPPPASDDAATCNAEPARRFIGETATPEVIEQARAASGARVARTLKPGQMVTMEYNDSRLNLDVDAANLITNARCG